MPQGGRGRLDPASFTSLGELFHMIGTDSSGNTLIGVRNAPTPEARGRDCFKKNRSIAAMKPDFGRTCTQHFCTNNRNSNNGYLYFRSPTPRIQDGALVGPINPNGSYSTGEKLVPNADRNLDGGSIARQIDAHWFICRN